MQYKIGNLDQKMELQKLTVPDGEPIPHDLERDEFLKEVQARKRRKFAHQAQQLKTDP